MDSLKRAYIILHPHTSGGRMLSQAFVAAGCFGDPQVDVDTKAHLTGHWQRLDLMAAQTPEMILGRNEISEDAFAEYFAQTLEDAPDVIVWRRSVPHGPLDLEKCVEIVWHAHRAGYNTQIIVPWRTPCVTSEFIDARGVWDHRHRALLDILHWARGMSPFMIHYDAFVVSPEYRRFVGHTLNLPNVPGFEKLKYVHAGLKWNDAKWRKIGMQTDYTLGINNNVGDDDVDDNVGDDDNNVDDNVGDVDEARK